MSNDVSRETFRAALYQGSVDLGLFLPDEVLEKSVALYALLVEWNRAHNLTRIIEPHEAAYRHFIESWTPLLIPGLFEDVASVADIGSGAGFPGLPLAMARPDIFFTLVEKAPKKAAFLSFAAATLGLANVAVLCADARHISDKFDLVAFRALTSEERFIGELASLLSPCGRLLLFLGASQSIPSGFHSEEICFSFSGRNTRLALLHTNDLALR